MRVWLAIALLAAAGIELREAGAERPSPVRVTHLTCEYLVDPIGIDVRQPRLSWILESPARGERQTAYQILVASSEAALQQNRGDLWDSGRVASDRSIQVPYGGSPLRSGQRCWWKVRVWDRAGRASAWSRPALWEMGLLDASDWKARWIARTADPSPQPAPFFRRAFQIRGRVRRARAYVCGLGYYELRLNGRKVGDHVLDPGYTRFDRRALYVTYDIAPYLRQGENVVGAILGNGWFNVHTRAVWYFDRAPWRASPRLLAQLRIEYADGRTETIGTDERWKTATGPILYDSIYGGETYDARLERPGWDAPGYDDSGWESARVVPAPTTNLAAQKMPPIRITGTRVPVRVTQPKPGVFVYDLGQNLSGHAQLRVSGPAGTKVTLRYGERLAKDGTLDVAKIAQHMIKDPPQRFQTDEYILKGEGTEVWEPRFVYHGFQYVQVEGFPGTLTLENLRGRVTHTDVAPAGEFRCSDSLLNRIQEATRWSYLSNLASIPTDCPHREKNGWTGDAHLAAEQAIFNFHPAAVYTKWIDDLGDEMRPTGELPGIVPTSGWGYEWGNGPAWDSAYLLIPWCLYTYYGDTAILAAHYDRMRRYVDYLTSRAKDGIVGIGLGDWVAPGPTAPVELTSTAYYYVDAQIVSEAARILGRADDARRYAELAEGIRRAFNARFFDPATGNYANGTQTALAAPLYQGLAPEAHRQAVLDRLVAAVEAKGGHLDAGILGTKYLLNTLAENGRPDVAFRIATQRTYPSWGHWIERGATTLWEDWAGNESLNHIMFGDISAWFYKTLGGIQPDPSAPGFKRFRLRPYFPKELAWASAVYPSIHGRIESRWERSPGGLRWQVRIPANTTATIWLPAGAEALTESGRPLERAEGLRLLRQEGGFRVVEAGSGLYRFAWREAAP